MKKILALFALAALFCAFTTNADAGVNFTGKNLKKDFGTDKVELVSGKKITLGSLVGKATYVVIISTDCGYCLQLINYIGMLKDIHGENLNAIAVANESVSELEFYKKKMPKGVLLGHMDFRRSKLTTFFDIRGVPKSVGFMKNGDAALAGVGANPQLIKAMSYILEKQL